MRLPQGEGAEDEEERAAVLEVLGVLGVLEVLMRRTKEIKIEMEKFNVIISSIFTITMNLTSEAQSICATFRKQKEIYSSSNTLSRHMVHKK